MSALTLEDLQAQIAAMSAALTDSFKPIVYRDIDDTEERLFIGGVDVTTLRGVWSQIGGYQLQEPYAYGPADFQFPQVDELERAKFGAKGDLRWLRHGVTAELIEYSNGVRGSIIWRGFITAIRTSSQDGVSVHCDGDVSGRLALRLRQAMVFNRRKDRGEFIYYAIQEAGVTITPRFGAVTGFIGNNSGSGSFLDFVDSHLAQCITDSGQQWTVARYGNGRRYKMRLKDTTTIHATLFAGTEGVNIDVGTDIQEEPTSVYGTGIDPNGRKWINPSTPNWVRGPAAAYPFHDHRDFGVGTTNDETDTKVGVTVLEAKLNGLGFLDREERDAKYDEDTAEAVRRVQRRAKLPRTGRMDLDTWHALYNVSVTGRSTWRSFIMPLAELDQVDRWVRTANGSENYLNRKFDPEMKQVDVIFDHGPDTPKVRAARWSERYLDRIHEAENLVGTIELDGADLFAGNVSRSTTNPQILPARKFVEGMNVKVWWNNTYSVFHVSGVNVGDGKYRYAIDSRARDMLTVGQIIARNKESRRSPSREWLREYRRPGAFDNQVVFSEIGGILDEDVFLPGHQWTQVEIPAGQFGSIEKVKLHLRDNRARFVFGITGMDVSAKWMNHQCPNPFSVRVVHVPKKDAVPAHDGEPAKDAVAAHDDTFESRWVNPHFQHRLKIDKLFYYCIGQRTQPCGFYPGKLTGDNGKPTKDDLTGDWEDTPSFPFRTFGRAASLYLLIYPDRDAHLQSGRLLYPLLGEGS